MKFLDECKIYLRSGDGGAGATAFRREKFLEFGGPSGGNGGRGGDVVIEAVEGLNTLIDYRYQQHFKAPKGDHGRGSDMTGAAADDIVLRVPVGTQVLAEDKETLLFDLTVAGQREVLCKGGDGGFGNSHFKTATNRAPRMSTPGWPGEERWVWLRLKLIADAGLVGLPNAGKSTFLSAVSAAEPKIADYPFTTLTPQLGVVAVGEKSFVLADIPGLIEGASEGAGLGTRFLGHIERCGELLHLVDATQDDVAECYRTIRAELAAYGHGLAEKTEILALNKIDALPAEDLEVQAAFLAEAAGKPVHRLSGVTGEGVRPILFALLEQVEAFRAAERRAEAAASAPPPDPDAPPESWRPE